MENSNVIRSWNVWEPHVNRLKDALASHPPHTDLQDFLISCIRQYEDHLFVSSVDEALAVVSGYGCSVLEIAFMWFGRWRPTSAIVLVYSMMGVELPGGEMMFENGVGQTSSASNPLNEKQLSSLGSLQKHALQEESDLSQKLAVLQMLLVEQNTVAALENGEMNGSSSSEGNVGGINDNKNNSNPSEFEQLIEVKLKELQSLLEAADNLRLQTLRALLDILTPVQAASCMVAAYNLMLALESLSRSSSNS